MVRTDFININRIKTQMLQFEEDEVPRDRLQFDPSTWKVILYRKPMDSIQHIFMVMYDPSEDLLNEVIFVSESREKAEEFMRGPRQGVKFGYMRLVQVRVNQYITEGIANEEEVVTYNDSDTVETTNDVIGKYRNILYSTLPILTMQQLVDPNLCSNNHDGALFKDPVEFLYPPTEEQRKSAKPINMQMPVVPDNLSNGMQLINMHIQNILRRQSKNVIEWRAFMSTTTDITDQIVLTAARRDNTAMQLSNISLTMPDMTNIMVKDSMAYMIYSTWAKPKPYVVSSLALNRRCAAISIHGTVWGLVRDILLFKANNRLTRAFMNITIVNSQGAHANVLLLWKRNDVTLAMVFEPHGGDSAYPAIESLEPLMLLTGVRMVEVPYNGVQSIERMISHVQRADESGYCALWCIVVIELFVNYTDVAPPMMMQLLWIALSDPRAALGFIRSYADYAREMMSNKNELAIINRIVNSHSKP
jgi:hypothetical protein